jgi:hypothetical protein
VAEYYSRISKTDRFFNLAEAELGIVLMARAICPSWFRLPGNPAGILF